jgi:mRNA interferase MazF
VTSRGSICWADPGEAHGSKPAQRRPVLVVQADSFNASRLNTTIAAVITSNTTLAMMPGNPYVRFSRIRLTDDLLDMVTLPSDSG